MSFKTRTGKRIFLIAWLLLNVTGTAVFLWFFIRAYLHARWAMDTHP